MYGYIYQAAVVCDDCALKIKKDLNRKAWEGKIPEAEIPSDPTDERSFDSDDYPKGPYDMGDEESDSPQHCDKCGIFLENQLTSEGEEYVIEAVRENREAKKKGKKSNPVVEEWERHYDYLDFDEDENGEDEEEQD
jgi:hypothetical protein